MKKKLLSYSESKLFSLLVIGVMLLAPILSFGQSQEQSMQDMQKRFPTLMNVYGAKMQNVDIEYLVAVDLSGSMNKISDNGSSYIENVKQGLIQFLQAVPDNSKISIVGFGTTVRWIQIPTDVNEQSRQEISKVISSIKANEGYTDLKGAVNFLIEGCSSASNIKYLFMFTDFNNDPTASSPFNSISWETLQQKYAIVSKNYLVEAFALKLPIAHNAGRDLPSVRMVFTGLNVIDFDSVSLQAWFNNRSSKLLEQNLWTFVSNDLDKIRNKQQLHLKPSLGIGGGLSLTARPDSLPTFVVGIDIEEMPIKDLVIKGSENTLSFTPAKLMFGKTAKIGKITYKNPGTPVANLSQLAGVVTGHLITSCETELEQLYVSITVSDKLKEVKNADEYPHLFYSQEISLSGKPYIVWNVWLFFGVLIAILVFLFFLFKNTILPQSLAHYAVKINDGDLIKLKNKKRYTVSSEKGDFKLNVPNTVEFDIFCSRSTPFNLLVKKSVSIRIKKGNPTVRVSNTLISKRKTYKLPTYKEITIIEGVSNIEIQFYNVKPCVSTKSCGRLL